MKLLITVCLFEASREGLALLCEVKPRGNYLWFLRAHVLGNAVCLLVKGTDFLQALYCLIFSSQTYSPYFTGRGFLRTPAIRISTVSCCASLSQQGVIRLNVGLNARWICSNLSGGEDNEWS